MENGFRLWRLYGSYTFTDGHNALGVEIGFTDVPDDEDNRIAHTFTIAIQISYFLFALGIILWEE